MLSNICDIEFVWLLFEMERGKYNKRVDIFFCVVYRSKEFIVFIELEGGVIGVNVDRDWINGNGCLL